MSDDSAGQGQLTRETWRRFVRAVTAFVTSEVGGRAAALFTTLLALMLAINGLNVLNSYNYMIQILPVLIVAPLFIRGEVEFGVITQSAMAFSHLLGAFSLVVTQFQAISLREQQLLSIARLTSVRLSDGEIGLEYCDTVLELKDEGGWSWHPVRDGAVIADRARGGDTP